MDEAARSVVPVEFMLGPWQARYVYATPGDPLDPDAPTGSIPAALAIRHPWPSPGHTLIVCWTAGVRGESYAVYPLRSLNPLTVGLPVVCRECGAAGRIEQGAWLPAGSGGIGGSS